MPEQWVAMNVAANKLGITANKITRWAARGLIETKSNLFNKRSRLVNLAELRERLAELNTIQGISNDSEEENQVKIDRGKFSHGGTLVDNESGS